MIDAPDPTRLHPGRRAASRGVRQAARQQSQRGVRDYSYYDDPEDPLAFDRLTRTGRSRCGRSSSLVAQPARNS